MNICIFCSAYNIDDKYIQPAKELAVLLANDGHHLVWGGSNTGMMGVIADVFKKNGGKLYGISLEDYKHQVHESDDEMIIAKDLGTRKAAMLSKSDFILVLPGGIGTLDELTEILELKKQKHHDKPIVVMSTDGFYDHFEQQLDRMSREGFTPVRINKLATFVDAPHEVINIVDN